MNNYKMLVILLALLTFSFFVSAEWNIEILEEPNNLESVSDNGETVQMVEVTDHNDDPVNESGLEASDRSVDFIYPEDGDRTSMEWFDEGYYYAQFELNSSEGTEVEYQINDPGPVLVDNVSNTYNPGSIELEFITDLSDPVDPVHGIDVEVNATDPDGNYEEDADVNFYVTNVSWVSDVRDTNEEGDRYENLEQDFDGNLEFGESYVIHAVAENQSLEYSDPFGSTSAVMETLPELSGELQRLESSGCDSEIMECERGSEVDVEINITESEAENVSMDLELYNLSADEWQNQTEIILEEDGANFTVTFEVPEINTTAFSDEMNLAFELENENTSSMFEERIDYLDYKINDISSSTANPPEYEVRFESLKQISNTPLEEDWLTGYVNITGEDTGEEHTSFNLSDMDYSSSDGVYSHNVDLESTDEGDYIREITVENPYGEESISEGDFTVSSVDTSFSIEEDQIIFDIQRERIYNEDVNLTDHGSGPIIANSSDEFEDIVTVNNGSAIELDEGDQETVDIEFNITDVENMEGSITFMDNSSNYNESVDVTVLAPNCEYQNGSYCATGNLDLVQDDEDEIERTLVFNYIGPEDHEEAITPQISGNISDYLEVEPGVVDINTENSSFEFNLTYNVDEPGVFTGDIELGELEVPTTLESNIEATELSIDVQDTLNLGVLPEGSESTETVDIENTGDVDLESVDFSSFDFNIESDEITLSSGESEEIELTIMEIIGSGNVDVEASSNGETVSETLNVNVETVPNLDEEADNLRDQRSDLESRADDETVRTQLSQLSTDISEMETQYNQGNYEDANSRYEEITSSLSSIEQQVGDEGFDDSTGEGGQIGDGETDGNGLGMIPLAGGLLVFMLILFVIGTSIQPEKGDRLYNVLGK